MVGHCHMALQGTLGGCILWGVMRCLVPERELLRARDVAMGPSLCAAWFLASLFNSFVVHCYMAFQDAFCGRIRWGSLRVKV